MEAMGLSDEACLTFNETKPLWLNNMLSMNNTEIVEIIYMLLFFLIGTPINAYALSKSLKMHRENRSEMRLLRLTRHLLIAHLMVLTINCLWRTFWFINVVWTLGEYACKFYSFITALPFHLWSNMVAAIAVDMYFCLTSPLQSVHKGHARVSVLILFSWISAIVCSFPMLVFRGTEAIRESENGSCLIVDGKKLMQCMHLFSRYSIDTLYGFNLFHVLTTFYVPLTTIVICYSLIGLSLRKQIVKRATLRSDASKLCKSTQTKFMKATIAIIATFVFTWLPYQTLALLQVLCAKSEQCQNVLSQVHWLEAIMIASTCINPFLYKFNTRQKRPPANGKNSISFQDSDRLLRSQITQTSTKTTPSIYRSQTFSQADSLQAARGKAVANMLLSIDRKSIPTTELQYLPKQSSLTLLSSNNISANL